jgi:hypothetical protein
MRTLELCPLFQQPFFQPAPISNRRRAPFDEPFSFQICGLFKVRNGKLLRIEALVTPVPYGMPTGWGGTPSHKE